MKTELKYCPFCHASGADIIAGDNEVECTVCGATHNYHMWQCRPTEASTAATVQPTEGQRQAALAVVHEEIRAQTEVINHPAAKGFHITKAKEELAKWQTIKAALQSPAVPKNVDGLVKAAQDFIDKCDRGEARSVRSYKAFKEALTLLGGKVGK